MMTFTIDNKALALLEKWKKKQDTKSRKKSKLYSEGQYTYSFSPTGIGTAIRVENTLTKDVIDITDYDSW